MIGMFGALGTSKALSMDVPLVPAAPIGVRAAVGGGILRDVIMGLPVAIMHVGSLYAVAVGAGCLTPGCHQPARRATGIAAIISVATTTVIRLLAVDL